MTKNFFILLFCTLFLTETPVFGASGPLYENHKSASDLCSAPPPSDFHITSIGTSSISLAWTPAWEEAFHTLTILNHQPNGSWELVDTVHNVPGSSYTAAELESGEEYRFVIATNCVTGEPSELTAINDGIVLVFDLVLAGRVPRDPQPVEDCEHIVYADHEWVGFKIVDERWQVENLFEFIGIGSEITNSNFFQTIHIARVVESSVIVQANDENVHPTGFNPIVGSVNPFRVNRLFGNDKLIIGYVIQTYDPTDSNIIGLCADYNNIHQSWRNFYTFTALTAEAIDNTFNSPGYNDRYEPKVSNSFFAQNPIYEALNVSVPHEYLNSQTKLSLLNLNEQKVIEDCLISGQERVSIPLKKLPSGLYLLRIQADDKIQVLKVVKP